MFSCYSKSMNQTITDTVDLKFRQQNQVKRRTRIPFTKEEDQQLLQLVQYFGINDKNNWYFIAIHMNGRSPRQCRERYQLFLSDRVKKKEKWTKEEDQLLISKYKIYGPHWKQMEQFFDGRTSYNILRIDLFHLTADLNLILKTKPQIKILKILNLLHLKKEFHKIQIRYLIMSILLF